MLCTVIKGPTLQEVQDQIALAISKCSLLELRTDYFKEWTLQDLQSLRNKFHIPMIFTLRSKTQGGVYEGSKESKLSKLWELASLKPEYIDIEYDTPQEFVEKLTQAYPSVKIIVSYHDFEKMPDLDATLQRMQLTNADLYKIAVFLHSSTEALSLLQFMKTHPKVLAMGMGPFGKITRILAPIFGGAFVYASIDEESITAPGQLTLDELNQVYNYPSLNPATAILGLIGDPIDKSWGHIVHNALIKENGLNSVYLKMPVSPTELSAFMELYRTIGFLGMSVTMPHKETIIDYLDDIDPFAKHVQAVNTIVAQGSCLKGYNTDGKGALDAISEKTAIEGKNIIILGAGGAAKAIAAESLARGAQVTVLNRTIDRAIALGEHLGCSSGSLDQMEEIYKRGYDILINVTPSELPIDPSWILPNSIVMDIQLQPKFTKLLLEAKMKGCTLVYGYEMWINQALSQFELWYQLAPCSHAKSLMKSLILQIIKEH